MSTAIVFEHVAYEDAVTLRIAPNFVLILMPVPRGCGGPMLPWRHDGGCRSCGRRPV